MAWGRGARQGWVDVQGDQDENKGVWHIPSGDWMGKFDLCTVDQRVVGRPYSPNFPPRRQTFQRGDATVFLRTRPPGEYSPNSSVVTDPRTVDH